MSNTNTGGQVFSGLKLTSAHGNMASAQGSEYTPIGGMTLRDYFAAKAMQGICSSRSHSDLRGHVIGSAKVAYEMADAMLKARDA